MRRALLSLLIVVAVGPAPALAQGPVPAPPGTPLPAQPTTPPAQGSFTLTPEEVGPGHTVFAGTHFRIRGVVTPYVAGQTATVRFYRGGHKFLVKTVSLLPSRSGDSGYFLVGRTLSRAGSITVKASHAGTPQLAAVVARSVTVHVLSAHLSPGSRGPAVRLLQQRLRALHYVVGRLGRFDARTARAVQAFRKLNNMSRSMTAGPSLFSRLRHGRGFAVRFPSHGRHVEGDLTHQVIALIGAGGHVERIYPASSGKPSTPTILGHFRVYSKTPGTNAKGMYFSNYFSRGYAIHGYPEVPPYAASHGCLRVPIPDAVPIYRWIRYGTPVDVYYR